MERHIALLLDLLGFSKAVLAGDVDRVDALLHFVQRLANLRGKFNLEGQSLPDGSYRFSGIRPEVTTFSDLLLLSFPLPAAGPQSLTPILADMWLQEAEKWVAFVATEALNLGLLVRGALALGPLYHDQTVAFGSALIEAHELESRAAVNPRVLLSTTLCNAMETDQTRRLLRDRDGRMHLNYFRGIFDVAVLGGPEFLDNARNWLQQKVVAIDQNTKTLSDRDLGGPAAKWVWFKYELLKAAEHRGICTTDL